jgi:predicted methyltransferase
LFIMGCVASSDESPGRAVEIRETKLKRFTALAAICTAIASATLVMTPVAIAQTTTAKADAGLSTAIANAARADAHKVRDTHRHPGETLAFFGIKPNMTVIEISPGSGYYAEILAPYLKSGGGKYIATGNPIAAMSDQAKWGAQAYVPFNATSGPLAPAGSADMVVTFRNIHNWMWQPGMVDKAMADFAAALKPGGVLGVEEHRADPRAEKVEGARSASDGYVSKATIVAAAKKAGLVLEAESEINANPKDTKDHPFGVWTLPPNSTTAPRGGQTPAGFDAAKYKAIGESDRHTLRFRKPA